MLVNNLVVGYSRFFNKQNEERLVVDVVKAPTDFDLKYGRVGMKVEQIWIPASLFDKFNNTVVGQIIECKYDISGRYANVTDVSFHPCK